MEEVDVNDMKVQEPPAQAPGFADEQQEEPAKDESTDEEVQKSDSHSINMGASDDNTHLRLDTVIKIKSDLSVAEEKKEDESVTGKDEESTEEAAEEAAKEAESDEKEEKGEEAEDKEESPKPDSVVESPSALELPAQEEEKVEAEASIVDTADDELLDTTAAKDSKDADITAPSSEKVEVDESEPRDPIQVHREREEMDQVSAQEEQTKEETEKEDTSTAPKGKDKNETTSGELQEKANPAPEESNPWTTTPVATEDIDDETSATDQPVQSEVSNRPSQSQDSDKPVTEAIITTKSTCLSEVFSEKSAKTVQFAEDTILSMRSDNAEASYPTANTASSGVRGIFSCGGPICGNLFGVDDSTQKASFEEQNSLVLKAETKESLEPSLSKPVEESLPEKEAEQPPKENQDVAEAASIPLPPSVESKDAEKQPQEESPAEQPQEQEEPPAEKPKEEPEEEVAAPKDETTTTCSDEAPIESTPIPSVEAPVTASVEENVGVAPSSPKGEAPDKEEVKALFAEEEEEESGPEKGGEAENVAEDAMESETVPVQENPYESLTATLKENDALVSSPVSGETVNNSASFDVQHDMSCTAVFSCGIVVPAKGGKVPEQPKHIPMSLSQDLIVEAREESERDIEARMLKDVSASVIFDIPTDGCSTTNTDQKEVEQSVGESPLEAPPTPSQHESKNETTEEQQKEPEEQKKETEEQKKETEEQQKETEPAPEKQIECLPPVVDPLPESEEKKDEGLPIDPVPELEEKKDESLPTDPVLEAQEKQDESVPIDPVPQSQDTVTAQPQNESEDTTQPQNEQKTSGQPQNDPHTKPPDLQTFPKKAGELAANDNVASPMPAPMKGVIVDDLDAAAKAQQEAYACGCTIL